MREDDMWQACIREVSEVLLKHGMTMEPILFVNDVTGPSKRWFRFRHGDQTTDFVAPMPIDPKTWARGTLRVMY